MITLSSNDVINYFPQSIDSKYFELQLQIVKEICQILQKILSLFNSNNLEIKRKRYTFSVVSDIDVEKSCFFFT